MRRLLAIGVLKPHEKLTVPVQPPQAFAMDAPIAVTNEIGGCVILAVDSGQITVENRTDHPSPFALLALPTAAARLLSLPWGQITDDIAQVGKQVSQVAKGLRRRGAATPPPPKKG
jgi:hypothetical protein